MNSNPPLNIGVKCMTTCRNVFSGFRLASVLSMSIFISCTSTGNGRLDSQQSQVSEDDFGVLVMAHGGSRDWNAGVENSLAFIKSQYPVEIAFGMADAGSIEASTRKLEAQGVKHVGVVRLFVSGESWYERTSQILGLQEGAPEKPADHDAADTGHMRMAMGFWEIDTDLEFHMSKEGLAEAEEMDQVLLSRVRNLSSDPASEVVAIIAHGPGDDAENERWISEISERTALLKKELGIADVKTFTLREDWKGKRASAEETIRDYVQSASLKGFTAIVVPFRVQGFGPYASVLEGLDYSADQLGLTPHDNVALWIQNQAEELRIQATEHRTRLAKSEL